MANDQAFEQLRQDLVFGGWTQPNSMLFALKRYHERLVEPRLAAIEADIAYIKEHYVQHGPPANMTSDMSMEPIVAIEPTSEEAPLDVENVVENLADNDISSS